ncbi:rhodanese-like domain-containing protein [Eionea flava]
MNVMSFHDPKGSLIAFAIIVALFFCVNTYAEKAPVINWEKSTPQVSVSEAHQLSITHQLLLVDIRSEKEWQETGVAPQAKLISMHQAGGVPVFEQSLKALLDGDKHRPIALICAGGVRSARIQRYLKAQGFTHVVDVVEGMEGGILTDGWIDEGLPVVDYRVLKGL